MANLPKSLESSFERQSTLIAAYQPENDLAALIERYRTGPFRPDPQVYESVFHDECDTVFGIDLRKWGEGGVGLLSVSPEKKEAIPEVLSALLRALAAGYEKLPSDEGECILTVPVYISKHRLQKNERPGYMKSPW